jgi:flavodoxin
MRVLAGRGSGGPNDLLRRRGPVEVSGGRALILQAACSVKALVLYYSRTGRTRAVAQQIASALGNAPIQELRDRADRRGVVGYARSIRDAWQHRRAKLFPLDLDPRDFDVLFIGTPVWNASPATPVATFLEDHAPALRAVAFFCTLGGGGSEHVFLEMMAACGQLPLATLATTERQLARHARPEGLTGFLAQVHHRLGLAVDAPGAAG